MATLKLPSALVSTAWLAEHLDSPQLILLDASMVNPVTGESNEQGGAIGIPHAQRFDFDKQICDQSSDLPHMLPSAEFFTTEAQKLGINKDSLIVFYDRVGVYSSPRGWWMFRAMGHTQVAVLNGGFPAWQAAGNPCAASDPAPRPIGDFVANYRPEFVRNSHQVLRALSSPEVDVLDARSGGRFYGTEPEPRAGLRPGHMPQSINLPFNRLVDQGQMVSKAALEKIFAEKQANKKKPLIFSCGSGVTASILALGAELAGYTDISVYDGSWSEWGLPSDLPVTTAKEQETVDNSRCF